MDTSLSPCQLTLLNLLCKGTLSNPSCLNTPLNLLCLNTLRNTYLNIPFNRLYQDTLSNLYLNWRMRRQLLFIPSKSLDIINSATRSKSRRSESDLSPFQVYSIDL